MTWLRMGGMKKNLIFMAVIGILPILMLFFFYVLPAFRTVMMDAKRDQLKASVDIAWAIVDYYHKEANAGRYSEAEAKRLAKDALRGVRMNGSDYIFIYNVDTGVLELQPARPEQEGASRLEQKDPAGTLFVKAMIEIGKTQGTGYFAYLFPRLKGEGNTEKLSYVRIVDGWRWLIATGMYTENVDIQAQELRLHLMLGLLAVAVFSMIVIGTYSHRLTQKFSKISGEIGTASKTLLEAGEQLTGASEDVSQGSTEAAASLEKTVASLEELSSMVRQNSEHAEEANQLSQKSREAAMTGESQVGRLNEAMGEITASSKKIAEIVDVIDDLAFQTNLLALNAAVEAARAGEQGKGFAVVAEAVRNLASRSANSAKDISNLIKENVESSGRGSEIARANADALREIVASVAKVSALNKEIAAASREQSQGLQQISKAMTQLDQTTQTNASSGEQAAAAASEIKAMADLVDQCVARFQEVVYGSNHAAASADFENARANVSVLAPKKAAKRKAS